MDKIIIAHGTGQEKADRKAGVYFEKSFSSRRKFSNYVEVIPDTHWKSISFLGTLDRIGKDKAIELIRDTDELVVVGHNPDGFSGQVDVMTCHLVETVDELYEVIEKYRPLRFFQISSREVRIETFVNGEGELLERILE